VGLARRFAYQRRDLVANFPTTAAAFYQNREILLLQTVLKRLFDGQSNAKMQKVTAIVSKTPFALVKTAVLVGFLASKSRAGTWSRIFLPPPPQSIKIVRFCTFN